MTCCGLAVRSAGDIKTARLMAKHNIEKLAKFDRIITGCATCGSALKDYGKWFGDKDPFKKQAQEFSAKVSDFSEFLAKEGIKSKAAEPVVVTYHDPCHMKWHQGISSQPRELLRAIEGVKFVEMEGADDCCGHGRGVHAGAPRHQPGDSGQENAKHQEYRRANRGDFLPGMPDSAQRRGAAE